MDDQFSRRRRSAAQPARHRDQNRKTPGLGGQRLGLTASWDALWSQVQKQSRGRSRVINNDKPVSIRTSEPSNSNSLHCGSALHLPQLPPVLWLQQCKNLCYRQSDFAQIRLARRPALWAGLSTLQQSREGPAGEAQTQGKAPRPEVASWLAVEPGRDLLLLETIQ